MKPSCVTRILLLLLIPAVLLVSVVPADAARRQKDEEKKASLFPNATRKDPGMSAQQRFQKDMQRMFDAAEDENHDLAIELADKVINHPKAGRYERAVSHQNSAFVLMEQNRDPEAAERLEKAIAEDALNNDIHYQLMAQLAQIKAQEEDLEGALIWIDRLITETRSERDDYAILKANTLFQLDRFQESVDIIKMVLARSTDPQPSWSQLLMAAYFEMEQPLEAAKIAEAQLERNPRDKQMLMNLASIYIEADRYDEAAGALTRARTQGLLTEDRDYRQLYRLYLNIDGQEAAAVEVINEGLEKKILEPNLEVYNILGQAYYFSDKVDEAIEAWKQADSFATDGEVALNLARTYYNEERYADAKASARRAIDKGVKRPGDAWVIIGNSEYFGMDNRAGGIAAYREAAKFPETKEQAETWLRQSRNM